MKIFGIKPFPYLDCEKGVLEQFQPGVEVKIIDLIYTHNELEIGGEVTKTGFEGFSLCAIEDKWILFRNHYWDTHIKIITIND